MSRKGALPHTMPKEEGSEEEEAKERMEKS